MSGHRNQGVPRLGYCRGRTVEGGKVKWRFGVLSPAARVNSGGGLRKRIPTSFETRLAACSSRVTPTLPLLSATLEWRAGCAERCTSGSGRRGREIVRLRPVSHSTADGQGLCLLGGDPGSVQPQGAELPGEQCP